MCLEPLGPERVPQVAGLPACDDCAWADRDRMQTEWDDAAVALAVEAVRAGDPEAALALIVQAAEVVA